MRALPTSSDSGYALQPDTLQAAITPRTRWLLLNSPSNPSGTTYSAEQLHALAEVVRNSKHQDFLILSDDIYEHILFDGARFATLAEVAPDLRPRILTINGVSKAYAMTGWRVGYGCGPHALIDAMTKVQMQINSHTSSVSQAAAVAALDGPQEEVRRRNAVFEHRRDLLVKQLDAIPGLRTPCPQGAFYLFSDVRAFLACTAPGGAAITDDVTLASYLLDEGVAVVPGSGFGMPGFIRLSFASADDTLCLAAARLTAALGALS